jgi:hypothetical protein
MTFPEWFFAGHLGALLIRCGIIITGTGRIAAAVVACQCLFDTGSRVSVFIIFRDSSALLLMRCSPLPVRRLPGCGSRCSTPCVAGSWTSCGWASRSGGSACPHTRPRRNVYSGQRVIVSTSKMAVSAVQIVMPPTLHERI